jgi:hypothetical protein
MSELQLLFLVLTVIYGWECACWIHRGSVALVTWLGRDWRINHPGPLLGNPRGGFIFAHPLPPLGMLLTAGQFPVSISTEAILAWAVSSAGGGGQPLQTGKLFRFDAIERIATDGRKIQINGELLLKAVTPMRAVQLAKQLRELKEMASGSREKGIEKLIRASLDFKAADRRWRDFREQTMVVRRLTNGLFIYLFALTPAVIWWIGLLRCWPWLVAGLLAFDITTAIIFRRVHRAFYPEANEERFTHFLTVLLSPATTIRALDILSRPLLEAFHPLVLAKILCHEEEFSDYARQIWLELRYPGKAGRPQESAAEAVERQWRETLQDAVAAFLRHQGVNPERLTRVPAPADSSSRSYCPRCGAQFTLTEGVCDDCGGVSLIPFAQPPAKGKAWKKT